MEGAPCWEWPARGEVSVRKERNRRADEQEDSSYFVLLLLWGSIS